jgi:hypothetical protein
MRLPCMCAARLCARDRRRRHNLAWKSKGAGTCKMRQLLIQQAQGPHCAPLGEAGDRRRGAGTSGRGPWGLCPHARLHAPPCGPMRLTIRPPPFQLLATRGALSVSIGPLIGAILVPRLNQSIAYLTVDRLNQSIRPALAVHTVPMLRAAPGPGPGPAAEEGGEEAPRSR